MTQGILQHATQPYAKHINMSGLEILMETNHRMGISIEAKCCLEICSLFSVFSEGKVDLSAK